MFFMLPSEASEKYFLKTIIVLVVLLFAAYGFIKIAENEAPRTIEQLANERERAMQVVSEIRVPHGVFLVSKQEIIWLIQWNVGKLAAIRASLEGGAGVPMSGVVFSPTGEWYSRPISMIRANKLAKVTAVIHPDDCRYFKILTGINKGVYAYPEGLPECE